MKYVFFIFILSASLMACQNEAAPADGTETAAATETADGLIHLSAAQLKEAGIQTGQPEQREIPTYLSCSGTIDVPPAYQQAVHSPVMGFVRNIRHLPGEQIRRGERLASIDHPDLVRLQRTFLETAAQLPYLQKDRDRKAELAQSDAASQRDYELAISELSIMQARYEGLKAELELIGIDAKNVEETKKIQSAIGIYAPAGGQLTHVEVRSGQLVQPETMLFQVTDDSHLHLELQVYAKDLHRVKKGQPVIANLPGEEAPITGTVHLVNQSIDMEQKTARVHVHLDEGTSKLAIGSFLFAKIQTDSRMALTVPEEALIRSGEEAFVFQETGNGFQRIPVKPGTAADGYVEISGNNITDRTPVALKGAYYINGTE
ncbi:efflux RND transporter periplasmic adaptor subunit [Phaeodactylibacter sp.]|uniref:efflux RND transporter periplasmic adaptor subunit n=1 Tax=Phaeodactylibacter sp. TaxID=1940289 RepID=UPI0025FFFD7B|nr:efflux RND transporter periplasmic adaptor subunit [Phaeodactylibacter sp.]MCI4648548.1 efflux RND transporter periplasmic adaptor subunit [Phaeodactylibacter sp.]MCI5090104.1 efflux RND transporter periplasmic adaptor subunit [Phaeodactylibacter sp.]